MREQLERMTLAQLRERFPDAPKSLKKAALIDRAVDALEARERRQRWEHEILVRGYPSILDSINRVRAGAKLEPVAALRAGQAPVDAALGEGHDGAVHATPSYLALFDGDRTVAEELCDEWGYEFSIKLAAGAYPEWSTLPS